ncbi:MAG: hypothetical protein OEV00_06520 [Acidobacteriota bacterium]|nr:hypothetical protein [Acidobacteriota bacterium]MDH3784965.1 hypothetical protein [Acidobacteriota bacterium]
MGQTASNCRRGHRRFKIHESREAWVGFTFPQPNGKMRRFRLLDVSVAGFSFETDLPFDQLEIGTTLHDTTCQIGECTLQGDLLVMHATDSDDSNICGVLFYPASDADLVKMKSLLAGLELGS